MAALTAFAASASAETITKFWNLTKNTVDGLQLAPAGSSDFGPNLCLADPDKSVDYDERLKISGLASGTYDAKLHDVAGRSCSAKSVKVEAGKVFSISEKELSGCTQ
ncbi:MAG TPA: hypothetical protein VMW18_10390 [Candidatus Binatia bacterium]|nr:hypothetical protein [Candidatus Binatia bacterium]